jgi:hypothetical protein
MRVKIICAFGLMMLVGLVRPVQCKYHYGFLGELFGREPSARAEALGKGNVTATGSVLETYSNPAGLAGAAALSFCTSSSKAFYTLEDARYTYLGGSLRVGRIGVIGVSRYHLDTRERMSQPTGGKDAYTPEYYVYTLTFSAEPIRDLFAGTNINLLRYNPSGEYSNVWWADLGLLKTIRLTRSDRMRQLLRVGGSIANFTYSEADVTDGTGDLPVTLRIGCSYSAAWWSRTYLTSLKTIELLVNLEYEDLLNSEYLDGYRLGGEVWLLEMIALRIGHYSEDIDDFGHAGNKGEEEETTYGLGIELPLDKLSDGDIPVVLSLDMVRLDQPSRTHGSAAYDKYSVYTFCIRYVGSGLGF